MPSINLGNNEVGLYPGGGGYPAKFYTGRLRPEVHPSLLDRPHLTKKVPHSSYLTKGYPFHIPSLELCITSNSCKCIVF